MMVSFQTQLAALNPVHADNDMPSSRQPPSTAAALNANGSGETSAPTTTTPPSTTKQPKGDTRHPNMGLCHGWRPKDLGVDGEKGYNRIKPSDRFQSLLTCVRTTYEN
jgi:hypothetical protein